MATTSDIDTVRLQTEEPSTTSTFSDEWIGERVDAVGVTGAIAEIWSAKAATFSKYVNVTEAGARHDMSQKFTHAKELAKIWQGKKETADNSGPRIRLIGRT